MKLVVVTKTHQILQQTFLLNGRAGVTDLHASPVGLPCDQAVAFKQVAHQHFRHWRLFKRSVQ